MDFGKAVSWQYIKKMHVILFFSFFVQDPKYIYIFYVCLLEPLLCHFLSALTFHMYGPYPSHFSSVHSNIESNITVSGRILLNVLQKPHQRAIGDKKVQATPLNFPDAS